MWENIGGWQVNLPAYLVVVKNTAYWDSTRKAYRQQLPSTIMQMAGRAGRPQFDDSGKVISSAVSVSTV